jgi:hypothetical protein
MKMRAKKKRAQEPGKAAPVLMKKVEHKGYTVVQSPRNHHVMIGKDGKMVHHAHYAIARQAIEHYMEDREEEE